MSRDPCLIFHAWFNIMSLHDEYVAFESFSMMVMTVSKALGIPPSRTAILSESLINETIFWTIFQQSCVESPCFLRGSKILSMMSSVKSNMVFAFLHVLSIVVQNFGISLASEHDNLKNFCRLCSLDDPDFGSKYSMIFL